MCGENRCKSRNFQCELWESQAIAALLCCPVNVGFSWILLTALFIPPRSRYLSKAFLMWSKQNKFTSTFINSVMSHVDTEHSRAAWMVLAKVAGSSPKLDYSKIIGSWDSVSRSVCVCFELHSAREPLVPFHKLPFSCWNPIFFLKFCSWKWSRAFEIRAVTQLLPQTFWVLIAFDRFCLNNACPRWEDGSAGIWGCLRALCCFSRQQNSSSDTVGHVLCVIGHVAKHLPKSSCEGLKGEWGGPEPPAEVLCFYKPWKV